MCLTEYKNGPLRKGLALPQILIHFGLFGRAANIKGAAFRFCQYANTSYFETCVVIAMKSMYLFVCYVYTPKKESVALVTAMDSWTIFYLSSRRAQEV